MLDEGQPLLDWNMIHPFFFSWMKCKQHTTCAGPNKLKPKFGHHGNSHPRTSTSTYRTLNLDRSTSRHPRAENKARPGTGVPNPDSLGHFLGLGHVLDRATSWGWRRTP